MSESRERVEAGVALVSLLRTVALTGKLALSTAPLPHAHRSAPRESRPKDDFSHDGCHGTQDIRYRREFSKHWFKLI